MNCITTNTFSCQDLIVLCPIVDLLAPRSDTSRSYPPSQQKLQQVFENNIVMRITLTV